MTPRPAADPAPGHPSDPGSTPALRCRALAVPGRLLPTDLEVAPASLHALLGPNGAGKSTLLQAVAGALPFAGAVTLGPPADRGVAYLPQAMALPRDLPVTVRELVDLDRSRGPLGLGPPRDHATRRDQALDQVGLADRAGACLAELSGGQLQRALLARLIAGDAGLWLLDEPERSLDAPGHEALAAALAAHRAAGGAALVATHDPRIADQLADARTRLTIEGPPAPAATEAAPGPSDANPEPEPAPRPDDPAPAT